MMTTRRASLALCAPAAVMAAMLAPAAAAAQDVFGPTRIGPSERRAPTAEGEEKSAFSGDYLSVGLGAMISPDYAGSNDYELNPVPAIKGSLGGIGFSPRSGGLSFDFIHAGEGPVDIDLGVGARLRRDRAGKVHDPVVAALGKLDKAFEVGVNAGVSVEGVVHRYDRLSFSADVGWDVSGAHGGMVASPGVSWFTPLGRGAAAAINVGFDWADADFHDYYYTVTPAQSAATGGAIQPFTPRGGGITNAGGTLLAGYDLDGNIANGGFVIVGALGWSRRMGDARATPYTSTLGSANQFMGAIGVGYTF